MKTLYCVIYNKYKTSEKPKLSYLLEKTLVPLLFGVSARMEMKKYLKKNQLRY